MSYQLEHQAARIAKAMERVADVLESLVKQNAEPNVARCAHCGAPLDQVGLIHNCVKGAKVQS